MSSSQSPQKPLARGTPPPSPAVTIFVFSTRNQHKVREFQSVLPASLRCLTLSAFPDAPEVVEDAGTFAGNATKKAVALARWLGAEPTRLERATSERDGGEVYCLADDSGLEVDALHGAPGVLSARFAADAHSGPGNTPDAANNEKLLRLLSDVPRDRRNARFRCCIAVTPVLLPVANLASPVCAADEAELNTHLFEGTCEGRIHTEPRGSHGFGYDPLFIPEGYDLSFAELGAEVKNQISHRAKALAQLRVALLPRLK